MNRLVAACGALCTIVLGAAISAPASRAAIEVRVSSPTAGTRVGDVGTVVPVDVVASATAGVFAVQLKVDGQPYPSSTAWTSTTVSQYTYEISWDTHGLAVGTHVLSAVAMDWSAPFPNGVTQESPAVSVDVGPPPPTVSLTAPAGGFVRGSVAVSASYASSDDPTTVQLTADGTALATTAAGGTATATWDTTKVPDGSHTVAAAVTDARGKSASASTGVTVDNTAPTTYLLSPASGAAATGTLAVSAHASDAYGIASVAFSVDGTRLGTTLTSPDGGAGYTYSETLSLSGLAGGGHQLTSIATDQAGNVTTSAAVPFTVGSGPPTAAITLPPDIGFSSGTVPVTASVSGGTAPVSVQLLVDGKAVGSAVTSSPYVFSWDTTKVADGAHTLSVTATDAAGRTATSAVVHRTVDNTPPQVYLTAPAAGSTAQGSVTVSIHASDAFGISSVQPTLDGTASGAALTTPDQAGGYTYTAKLSLTGVANGAHLLGAVATDNAHNTATAATVKLIVGSGTTPTVTISSPLPNAFAHGTVAVNATIAGGTAPFGAQLLVDGKSVATATPSSSTAVSLSWSTTGLADGAHTVQVGVTDAAGATALSASVAQTVDNTAPSGVMYQPTPTPGYAYARSNGPTTFQVHASDAYGIASVQFTVDGTATGPLLTAPDSGQQYLYSTSVDTSKLAAGLHAVGATVTDRAGNVAQAAPTLQVKTGPIVYLPVLNYHGITGPLDPSPDIYDESPAQADAELAYLKAQGYQSVTVEQYQTWLANGQLPAGVTKPILITVDDGTADEAAWDPLLQKYGFTAVLYVVTGFASNTTPNEDSTTHMTWTQIKSFAANGRWEIAFHAGRYGHADFSDPATTISVGTNQTQSYASSCFAFYNCLGTIATTTGTGRTRKTTTAPETPAQFESQVAADITTGLSDLKANVPSASTISFACPWNACGQWTTFYNDASGTLQGWLPGYLASKFPIVFMQTDPVTYGLASGTVGSLNGFNRHYRFEVHTDTTIAQFSAALADPGFANN